MAFVWQQSMDVQTLTRKRLHQICFFHIPQWGVLINGRRLLINGRRCKQLLDAAAGCCVRMVQPESFVTKILYLHPRVECCVQAEASHWLWAKNAICYKAPVFAAQSWIIVSSELNASQWPLGENSTAVTRGLWPWRIFCRAPVAASQTPMVLSSEVDTSHWPLAILADSMSFHSRVECSLPQKPMQASARRARMLWYWCCYCGPKRFQSSCCHITQPDCAVRWWKCEIRIIRWECHSIGPTISVSAKLLPLHSRFGWSYHRKKIQDTDHWTWIP